MERDLKSSRQSSIGRNVQSGKQSSVSRDTRSGKQSSVGRNLQSGKQSSVGRNLQSGKQSSVGRNLQSGKQSSVGRNLQSGKQSSVGRNLQSGKQSSVGRNLQSGKQSSVGRNLQSGKQSSVGRNLQSDKQSSVGRNLQSGKQSSFSRNVQSSRQNTIYLENHRSFIMEESEDANARYENDDDKDYNSRYKNIPTPVNGEELTSSDDEEEPQPEDEEEEEPISEEEEEDEIDRTPKDKNFDPHESWDMLIEIKCKLNILAVLIDDEELQQIWAQNEARQAAEKKEEEPEDDEYESEADEEEVDDELEQIIESEESEEELPPADIGDDEDIYKVDSDEFLDEDAFSFADVDENLDDDIDENDDYDENKENKEENEDNNGHVESEDEEQKVEEEEEVPIEKVARYRKLEKYNTSDTSEYETITSESEVNEQKGVEEEVEEVVEKEVEKKPTTPIDPFPWIEYEKEIDFLEEYDGDFMDHYMEKNALTSESSSTDESSDDDKGDYDLPLFDLPPAELSVVKNKRRNDEKRHLNQRKSRIVPSDRIRTASTNRKLVAKKKINQLKRTKKIIGYQSFGRDDQKYTIDLNVYNYSNYPEYENDDENEEEKEYGHDFQFQNDAKDQAVRKPSRSKSGRKRYYLKRKKRTECFKRLHPEYKEYEEVGKDVPDEDVPSYKARMTALVYKNKTIELVMETLLKQTFFAMEKVESARLRKEATHHSKAILLDLCDEMVKDIEEKQRIDAVNYGIEILLDSWEQHVYETRMKLIDAQLEVASEGVVFGSVTRACDEIVDEDIYSTLYVRDTLAVLLNEFGMKQIKINRKLGNMFIDYQFDNYDFETGGVTMKIKRKLYKPRKELDSYLSERLKKLKLGEDEEKRAEQAIAEKEKKEREKKEKEEIRREETEKAVIEKKKSFYSKEEEQERNSDTDDEIGKVDGENECEEENEEEEDMLKDEPKEGDITARMPKDRMYLSPDSSDLETTGVRRDTHELIDFEKTATIAIRARRRSKIVALWTKEQRQMLHNLRKVSDEEDEYTESEEDEEKKNKVSLNDLYAEEAAKEERHQMKTQNDEFDDYYVHALPNLQKEVEKAFARAHTPTMIKLINLNKDVERNDSALGSTNNGSATQRTSAGLRRHESGISSLATNELREHATEEIEPFDYEKDKPSEEIVKMIPKIDRDQYLQSWLYNGHPKYFAPSPPLCQQNKRVRRFHRKRPQTANSEDSIMDIIPLELNAFKMFSNEALNSGNLQERPETAGSYYTGRESAFSKREDVEEEQSEKEVEDNDEDNGDDRIHNKTMLTRKKKNSVQVKNTEIKFKEEKEPEVQKEEPNMEQAWSFYVGQKRIKQTEREYIVANPTTKESVVQVPVKELYIDERDEIILGCVVPLEERFENEEDVDQEILEIQQQSSEDEDEEKEREASSVLPPSTPWQREKERPPTPDSYDSEEELEQLKRDYIDGHRQNRQNEKLKHVPDRKWKEYLKKKYDSKKNQPPPPKSGWKASPGIIHWKNASEDVRKHRQNGSNPHETQTNINRELFQKLQIMARRDQQNKNKKLLERRKTLHNTDALSRSREVEKQKLYTPAQKNGNDRTSPETSRNTPSYLRPTQASENKFKRTNEDPKKLPSISHPVSAAPTNRYRTTQSGGRPRKQNKPV